MAAQETVETRGITSAIKIDEVIYGHLTELNGKFKLRATELTFAPPLSSATNSKSVKRFIVFSITLSPRRAA
jgi:hypothetical protein